MIKICIRLIIEEETFHFYYNKQNLQHIYESGTY